jgi:hypothetical protein
MKPSRSGRPLRSIPPTMHRRCRMPSLPPTSRHTACTNQRRGQRIFCRRPGAPGHHRSPRRKQGGLVWRKKVALVRIPADLKSWIVAEVEADGSSQNCLILRALRQAQRRRA